MEGITGAFLDQGEYKLGFEVLGPEKELFFPQGPQEPPRILVNRADIQKVWGRAWLCSFNRLPRRYTFEKGCLSEC